MMWIEWKGVKVLCAYFAPPTSPFQMRNEKRMQELQQTILETKGKVILLTDANGWIGQLPSTISEPQNGYERQTHTFARTSKKKETNKQGEWFLAEMNSIDMIIMNGVRSEAEYTYDHPGREASSVIDFVAANKSAFEVLSDLSYVDCRDSLQTDHILVTVQLQHSEMVASKGKKRVKRKKEKKPLMETLKTITIKDPFWKSLRIVCDEKLADFATIPGNSINEDYAELKEKLTEAVNHTLTRTKPMHIVLSAKLKSNATLERLMKEKFSLHNQAKAEPDVERRKALKKELSKTSNALKRESRKVINEFKRERVREIEHLEPDDCRRMWKELKRLSGWKRKEEISQIMFDEEKREVEGKEVEKVWARAFHALGVENAADTKFDVEFGEKVTQQQEEISSKSYDAENSLETLDDPIHLEETVEAIKRLKLGKAAGNDQIVAELLVKGGDQVASAVHLFCEKVWREEKMPSEWTRGIIFPIYKDGDKRDTSNYRGITLLSIVGKVYAQVINERLVKWSEENKILVEEQGGFRPQRGCPDQLFSLVELLKNRGRKGTFCCFIDVKKAFDRVFRAGLWKRLAEEGVKGKMWRVLKSIYETVESCVRVEGSLTDWFPVETGVRQGCVLSPLLYALFINGLVKEINAMNKGIEIEEGGRRVGALLYADDIVLMANNRYDLQDMLDVVARYAKKWRFELNPKK
jgi:hypothetical protein